MKITEITEQPVSGVRTGLQRAGSRVMRKIPGMKGHAANLAARSDHGETARNAYNQFAKFLGDRNKSIGQATGDDLKSFMDDMGLDSSGIDSGTVNKATLNSAMIDVATQIKSKNFKTGLSKSQNDAEKLKLPADVIAVVGKLPDDQKVKLARAILKKYGG